MGIPIGITGGIGSGKSIVTRIFHTMGYPVFYSDDEAKKLMIENDTLKGKVIEIFGDKAYIKGELNRKLLAEQVFKNPALKEKINQIIHPQVRQKFDEYQSQFDNNIPVFNEAAILFETGAFKNFKHTILITADQELKIARILKRDKTSRSEIKSRMENQWSDEKKIPMADFIINNNGDELLLPQVLNILKELNIKN